MRTIEQFKGEHPGRRVRTREVGVLRVTHRCNGCKREFEPLVYEFIAYRSLKEQFKRLPLVAGTLGGVGLSVWAGQQLAAGPFVAAACATPLLAVLAYVLFQMNLLFEAQGKDVLAKCRHCGSSDIACTEPDKLPSGDSGV